MLIFVSYDKQKHRNMKTYVVLTKVKRGGIERPELEFAENQIFSSVSDIHKKLWLGVDDTVLSMSEFMDWYNDYDCQVSEHNPINIGEQFFTYVRVDE